MHNSWFEWHNLTFDPRICGGNKSVLDTIDAVSGENVAEMSRFAGEIYLLSERIEVVVSAENVDKMTRFVG